MTALATFTVSGPPVGWQRPGQDGGRRYTPETTAAHERAVWGFCRAATGPIRVDRTSRFGIHVLAYQPLEVPDTDNVLKLIMDALNRHVWWDDRQVYDSHAVKRVSKTTPPRTEIIIWTLEADDE
jgi:Holliday junction resolvase RusA-like endonuclease